MNNNISGAVTVIWVLPEINVFVLFVFVNELHLKDISRSLNRAIIRLHGLCNTCINILFS